MAAAEEADGATDASHAEQADAEDGSSAEAEGAEAEPTPPSPPPFLSLAERLAALEEQGPEVGRRELDFSDEPVGDDGVAMMVRGLAKNSGLRRLRLRRARVGAHGLDALGDLLCQGGRAALQKQATEYSSKPSAVTVPSADTLELLALDGNDIGPGGLGREFLGGLATSVNLRSLLLANCSLGDAGVTGLFEVLGYWGGGGKTPCKLQELDLSHNGLTSVSARALVFPLGCNQNLRKLELKANELGVEGAEAIAECMRANKGRLQRLDVSQNNIQLDGARMLVERFLMPVRFTIKIFRPAGQSAGISLSREMKVMGVHPSGCVDKWNRENPSEAVLPGDVVTSVNGQTEATKMNRVMADKQDLEILIDRLGAGLGYLDISYNSITLAGVEELREDVARPAGGSSLGGLMSFERGRQINLNAA